MIFNLYKNTQPFFEQILYFSNVADPTIVST